MRKITLLSLAALSVVFAGRRRRRKGGLLPRSRPNTVVVQVREKLDDLEVTIKPWRREIEKEGNIKWILVDPHDLVLGDLEINSGKEAGCPEFPLQQASPGPNTVVYGPFKKNATGAWCKYNIVLHTAEGNVIVDPEYRVKPGL